MNQREESCITRISTFISLTFAGVPVVSGDPGSEEHWEHWESWRLLICAMPWHCLSAWGPACCEHPRVHQRNHISCLNSQHTIFPLGPQMTPSSMNRDISLGNWIAFSASIPCRIAYLPCVKLNILLCILIFSFKKQYKQGPLPSREHSGLCHLESHTTVSQTLHAVFPAPLLRIPSVLPLWIVCCSAHPDWASVCRVHCFACLI